MGIPGSNILNMALTVIAKQSWQWFSFASRITQPNGQWLSAYNAPVTVQGSSQAVPRNLYEQYGLEFNKDYQKFFVSQAVIDVGRDVSGDLFVFNGQNYQCLSLTPWYGIDGWVEILAVEIENEPLIGGLAVPAEGNYSTGFPLTFKIFYNQNVNVIGSVYLALSAISGNISSNPYFFSGSGTPTLTFIHTVIPPDTAAGLILSPSIVIPGGSSITNADGTVAAKTGFIAPDLSGITLNA